MKVTSCASGEKKGDDEPTTMKQKLERVKPLSEREVQAFLNDDRETSEQGSIQWRKDGIWRWVSSDGLAHAVSDGKTVDISRTANGETVTVSLLK
jgi:outer membrane lipoprotein-sorting protein